MVYKLVSLLLGLVVVVVVVVVVEEKDESVGNVWGDQIWDGGDTVRIDGPGKPNTIRLLSVGHIQRVQRSDLRSKFHSMQTQRHESSSRASSRG